MIKIQILGSECSNCDKLYEMSKEAADSLGIEYTIEKIKDIVKITGFGVMAVPALVINGEVKSSGRVPRIEDIKKFLVEKNRILKINENI